MEIESYKLQYDMFLAEQELFDSLTVLSSGAIHESIGLSTIHEGVKEVILQYIEKISTALQNAWDRFKQIVLNEKDKVYLKSIEKKMQNTEPHFTIENYPIYDMNLLDSIQVRPFDYAQMKEDLGSSDAYIDKYYSALKKDKEKSLQENITEIVVKSRQDTQCTDVILKSMYTFVTDTFPKKMSEMEKDLKTVNASNKNIQALVNQITPVETKQEAVAFYESFIHEADDDNKDEKVAYKDEEGVQTQKTDIKSCVVTYLKVSTDIISAKMKCYRDIYAFNMKTIKHYIKPAPEAKEEKPGEAQANPEKTQVKI